MSVKDQKTIWDFVKELLYDYDCVIVPGFGGFVANREPSRIDQISHVITPPRKHIIFNQNLKINDGLLASHVSEKLSVNYADAINLIEETVTKVKDTLNDKKQFAIEFFGNFRLNADANYVFLPDQQNNFLYNSFGLKPFHAQTVSGRTISKIKARTFKDRKEVKGVTNIKTRRRGVQILIGVFAFIFAINIFLLIKDPGLIIGQSTMSISTWFDSLFTSQPKQDFKIESPKSVTEQKKIIPTPLLKIEEQKISDSIISTKNDIDTNALNAAFAEHIYTINLKEFAQHISVAKNILYNSIDTALVTKTEAVSEKLPAEVHVELAPKNISPNYPTIKSDSSFYIIGGVFCKENNAKKFFHDLKEKGFEAEILLTPHNCNRVSYAKFASRKDAEHELKNIQATANPDAWLFVKQN